MISASVSNVDLFRVWRQSEDLDVSWLLRRLRGEEPQTEAMKAGEAFHKALETLNPDAGELFNLKCDGYEFAFTCDCECTLPSVRELKIKKDYPGLQVRGRIDGIYGDEITDYKTTAQFDPERLLEGYQWRFYLDMMGCSRFVWKVFVLSEQDGYYKVIQYHELSQHRYAGLEKDCAKLARDYFDFVTTPAIARELISKEAEQ